MLQYRCVTFGIETTETHSTWLKRIRKDTEPVPHGNRDSFSATGRNICVQSENIIACVCVPDNYVIFSLSSLSLSPNIVTHCLPSTRISAQTYFIIEYYLRIHCLFVSYGETNPSFLSCEDSQASIFLLKKKDNFFGYT